jgi:hypothetical protein
VIKISHVTAMVVVAAGIGAADIVRLTQHLELLPIQLSAPRPVDPAIQDDRRWLERKAEDREHAFQQQQRQQAEERRDLRWERRLDADRRLECQSASKSDPLSASKIDPLW